MSLKATAHRLRRYRKEAGLTQRGAARLLGVTPTQLMEWEKGKRMPTGKFMFMLVALYQRMSEDMYYELRQQAARQLRENRRKYGDKGEGKAKDRPP